MRKVLLFLGVIAATLTSCSKDETMAPEMNGSISLNAIINSVDSGSFSGKGPQDADGVAFTDSLTISLADNAGDVMSESLSFDGASEGDVIAAIGAVSFNDLPIGSYTLSVAIDGEQAINGSKLSLETKSYSVNLGDGQQESVDLALQPASGYVGGSFDANGAIIDSSVLTVAGNEIASGEGVYLTPGELITVDLAISLGGIELSESLKVIPEAGKYALVNFVYSNNGGHSLGATIGEFTEQADETDKWEYSAWEVDADFVIPASFTTTSTWNNVGGEAGGDVVSSTTEVSYYLFYGTADVLEFDSEAAAQNHLDASTALATGTYVLRIVDTVTESFAATTQDQERTIAVIAPGYDRPESRTATLIVVGIEDATPPVQEALTQTVPVATAQVSSDVETQTITVKAAYVGTPTSTFVEKGLIKA